MAGERLHDYDLHLCDYVLENVTPRPLRASLIEWLECQLRPPLRNYVLGREPHRERFLLSDEELWSLQLAFDDLPDGLDCAWLAEGAIHRRHIRCVRGIQNELTKQTADPAETVMIERPLAEDAAL